MVKVNVALELGDIVRLREPYETGTNGRKEVWTHGIVVEVVSTFDWLVAVDEKAGVTVAQGMKREGGIPRTVSLHLYNPKTGRIYIHPHSNIPVYVDFHVAELFFVKRASEPGYRESNIPVAED